MLTVGSHGSDVRRLQQALNRSGAKLTVDGDFGPATKRAVVAYQHSHHLGEDGVVGDKTGASIFKSRNTDLWDGVDEAGGSSRVEDRRSLSPKLRLVREIALLAKKHGVPAELPIITALTESGFRNLRGGDRDSVGLFQQRAAWGSFAERHDPIKSARLFLFGGHGGQRGALDFKSRFAHRGPSAYGAWAQAVQVSAFPGRYQTHLAEARRLLQQAGVKPGLN